MGAIQSRDEVRSAVGFLPEFHLLRLGAADMDRLFVPRNFMNRCHLISGGGVALLDCLGRTHSAVFESSCNVNYLGDGWPDFLKSIGAEVGDVLLMKFKSIRTCKVFAFNDKFGWQKYPAIDQRHLGKILAPNQSGCFFSSGWPIPLSPERALSAGPCTRAIECSAGSSVGTPLVRSAEACGSSVFNVTGQEIDSIMKEFLDDMAAIHELEIPMYYCWLLFSVSSKQIPLMRCVLVVKVGNMVDVFL